jgi:hypothetical protein
VEQELLSIPENLRSHKGVIRSYESKKDSQYNYQKKMVNNTNNDLQITKQKTKKIEQQQHC